MKTHTVPIIVTLGLALVVSSISVCASGSYSPRSSRPPRPPAGKSVDADKYNLGKEVFAGKAKLGTATAEASAAQAPRLKALQDQLPPSTQKSVNLPDHAGKLSARQMEALEYFLGIRYKVK